MQALMGKRSSSTRDRDRDTQASNLADAAVAGALLAADEARTLADGSAQSPRTSTGMPRPHEEAEAVPDGLYSDARLEVAAAATEMEEEEEEEEEVHEEQ